MNFPIFIFQNRANESCRYLSQIHQGQLYNNSGGGAGALGPALPQNDIRNCDTTIGCGKDKISNYK